MILDLKIGTKSSLGKLWASKLVIFRFGGVLGVLLGGLGVSFWSQNLPQIQKNHDLKTCFLREAFSEAFFYDSV